MSISELQQLPLAAPWAATTGPDGDVVVSSRIRLARNLADHAFPHAASESQRAKYGEIVTRAVRDELTPDPFGADAIEIEPADLSAADRGFLAERSLADRNMPARLFVGHDERLVVQVDGADHLRIVALRSGSDLAAALDAARRVDQTLERVLNYAVAMDWGYLSSEITNLGTAMRASVLVHVPALAALGRLEPMSASMENSGYEFVPFFGDESLGAGDEASALKSGLCLLRNRRTLGSDEDAIISKLEDYTTKLVHYERAGRDELRTAQSEEIADSANRALGILRFARSLSAVEARSLVSHLRLGVVSELVAHVAVETVTSLLLANQDSHIGRHVREGDGEDIDTARARVFRDMLARSQA
ncbi:MAG: hypothetical protein ACOC1U_11195 [Spirochaetota bacterium]